MERIHFPGSAKGYKLLASVNDMAAYELSVRSNQINQPAFQQNQERGRQRGTESMHYLWEVDMNKMHCVHV